MKTSIHSLKLIISIVTGLFLTWVIYYNTAEVNDVFLGDHYRPSNLVSSSTLFSTEWIRIELHKIKNNNKILDWIWVDVPEHINVLIKDNNEYIVFQQTKYGYDGDSLAVIGGQIEIDETPLQAAMRELKEETGLESTLGEKGWTSLGNYRVDANRGFGRVYCFIVNGPYRVYAKEDDKDNDLEIQTQVRMTEMELIQALLNGKFLELKWASTVAFSLLTPVNSNNYDVNE